MTLSRIITTTITGILTSVLILSGITTSALTQDKLDKMTSGVSYSGANRYIKEANTGIDNFTNNVKTYRNRILQDGQNCYKKNGLSNQIVGDSKDSKSATRKQCDKIFNNDKNAEAIIKCSIFDSLRRAYGQIDTSRTHGSITTNTRKQVNDYNSVFAKYTKLNLRVRGNCQRLNSRVEKIILPSINSKLITRNLKTNNKTVS